MRFFFHREYDWRTQTTSIIVVKKAPPGWWSTDRIIALLRQDLQTLLEVKQ